MEANPFYCNRLRCKLSRESCAARWRRHSRPGGVGSACHACPIGAANAGAEDGVLRETPGVSEVLTILREREVVSPVQVARRATDPHLRHRNQALRILRYLARVGAAERLGGGFFRVPGSVRTPLEPDEQGQQSERRRAVLLAWMRGTAAPAKVIEEPGGQLAWPCADPRDGVTTTTAWLYLQGAGIPSTREEARQALRVLVAHGFAVVEQDTAGRRVMLAEPKEAA